MTAVTLATLRTRARERADMPAAGFIADSATGIDAWINEGVQVLHEKLVKAYGANYVSKTQSFTTTGSDTVALPADFFQLLGVDLTLNGMVVTLEPFAQAERNRFQLSNATFWGVMARAPRYQLFGNNLRLRPAPSAGISGSYEYAPQATVLVNTSDTVDFPNGWERYVVLYTAIQMKMKQESAVNDLMDLLAVMDKDLKDLADLRDAANPAVAADVNPDGISRY